jgi:hypothetical protein
VRHVEHDSLEVEFEVVMARSDLQVPPEFRAGTVAAFRELDAMRRYIAEFALAHTQPRPTLSTENDGEAK